MINNGINYTNNDFSNNALQVTNQTIIPKQYNSQYINKLNNPISEINNTNNNEDEEVISTKGNFNKEETIVVQNEDMWTGVVCLIFLILIVIGIGIGMQYIINNMDTSRAQYIVLLSIILFLSCLCIFNLNSSSASSASSCA